MPMQGSDEDVGDEVHGRIPAAPAMESGDEIEEQYDYDDDFEVSKFAAHCLGTSK